jgi:hypothetical protein
MKKAIAVVVTIAALSGLAFAQAKPNFSGKWTETGAAAGETPMVLTVQQDAATLTVQWSPAPDRFVVKLDGSASKNITTQSDGRGIESVATAKWDGDRLLISIPGRSNGDGPYVATTTWSLSDGKLTVRETIVTQAGSSLRDYTRTYSR